jgi:DNA-directed RNA polymerase I and III subunit RPAC1
MNTSIIQDEVLSHRLGLIPLNVDPSLFETISDGEEPTDLNTLVFKLDVTCNEPTAEEMAGRDPDSTYTMNVYSKHLEWQPQGNQADRFPGQLTITINYFLSQTHRVCVCIL